MAKFQDAVGDDINHDVEHSPAYPSPTKADIEPPQLGVGGHGGTQRRLRDYQVTMIGFCSGIGTGLFIGTGSAYAKAGPAGLLLAYIVVGAVLWCVMQSISELATLVCILPGPVPAHVQADMFRRSPLPGRSLTGPPASLILLSVSPWPSPMVIATP